MTIGLFGTCGNSTWREPFISSYRNLGVDYFNPQVDVWSPEMATVEAEHLIQDEVILFPVTNETYGTGSLAETGFSILSAIRSDVNRFVILYIDTSVSQSLFDADPIAAKESTRSRALVRAHLKKMKCPNVFVVESLADMLSLSLELNDIVGALSVARMKYSIK